MRRTAFLLITGLVLAIASTSATASSYSSSAYSARLLGLVNDARQQHGLRPLAPVSGTTSVAIGWTQQMAAAGALSHNPDLGHQLESHGSSNWQTYGENVGVGSTGDPDDLFSAYMNSPEHRANILDPDYRYVGVAVLFAADRAWNTFDFVDTYGGVNTGQARPAYRHAVHQTRPTTATRRTAVAAPRPAVAAVPAPAPTRRITATSSHRIAPPPAKPAKPAVKALHQPVRAQPTRVVLADAAPAFVPTITSSIDVSGAAPSSHRRVVLIAIAVIALATATRRWTLSTGVAQ